MYLVIDINRSENVYITGTCPTFITEQTTRPVFYKFSYRGADFVLIAPSSALSPSGRGLNKLARRLIGRALFGNAVIIPYRNSDSSLLMLQSALERSTEEAIL